MKTYSRHSGVGMRKRQERREEGKNKGVKRWKKKKIERERVKPCTPILGIDAPIGDEEKTGKKKEAGIGSPTQLSLIIWLPPTTHRIIQ